MVEYSQHDLTVWLRWYDADPLAPQGLVEGIAADIALDKPLDLGELASQIRDFLSEVPVNFGAAVIRTVGGARAELLIDFPGPITREVNLTAAWDLVLPCILRHGATKVAHEQSRVRQVPALFAQGLGLTPGAITVVNLQRAGSHSYVTCQTHVGVFEVELRESGISLIRRQD